MSQPSRLRSIWIDEKGLEEVRQRMAELKKPEGLNKRGKSCWTEPHLADQAYVSLSTVKRFLRGKCDEDYAMAILKALGFEPLFFLANHDQNRRIRIHKPQQATEIDWQKVCSEMAQDQLDEQLFRVRATEKGFEVCVFIRLGLVERKQQQRRDGNVPLEQVYQLEQEVITKTYEHDEFLQKVIGQSPTRQNPHVAIVGEPGAGKTTQLGAIATYVHQETDRSPICISLGSLQEKSLKNYLLEEWLPEALSLVYPDLDLETQHEKSLQKWLRKGGVWLLLDGADEMAHDSKPLQTIQSELTDWLGRVRVVLTCRLNVWDTQVKNPLTGFDTYKTQEFRADQVNQFIEKWFTAAGEPQQSQTLQSKLQEPNRSRIRELVKNPLRLSLLCQVFYIDKNAKLPETKAGLYEKFVRYFYEWKPSQQFPNLILEEDLKNQLHAALGRLALAGLDSPQRFRLKQSVIYQEMQDEKLFKLAWELGWLNLVDRDAQTDEPVYAFFHPTFQEYFAALAIDDWHFLLNHVPRNLNKGTYRIFDSHWKEVFLLWFGREGIQSIDKQNLIALLVSFGDSCEDFHEGFHHYQAYFLAASALGEFCGYSILADRIIRQVVELTFGYINFKKHRWTTLPSFITDKAKSSLRETDCTIAVNAMSDLLDKIQKSKSLDNTLNQDLILTRKVKLLTSTNLESGILTLSRLLLELNPGNQKAIDTLRSLLDYQGWVHEVAASALLQVNPDDLKAKNIWSETSEKISGLDSSIFKAFSIMNSRISLAHQGISTMNVKSLIQKLCEGYESRDLDLILTIERLGEIGFGNNKVIAVLIFYLFRDDDPLICEKFYLSLKKVITSDFFPAIIEILKDYLINHRQTISFDGFKYGLHLLWHCAENMSYPDFYRAWHSPLPDGLKLDEDR